MRMPTSKVLTGFVLPTGNFDLELTTLTMEHSKSSGLLMFVSESKVVAPITAKGKPFREYFVIGKRPFTFRDPAVSDEDRAYAAIDDPGAEQEITWLRSSGFRKLTSLLKAAGLATDQDLDTDELVAVAPGLRYGARINCVVNTQEGKYFGKDQNEVAKYYAIGSETPGIDRENPPRPSATKPTLGLTAARASRVARTFSEDDETL